MGVGCLLPFCLLSEPFPFYCNAFSSPDMRLWSNPIVTFYTVLSLHPLEICSFLKGNGRVDMGERTCVKVEGEERKVAYNE